ncbi:MAG: hypothetical protein JSU77_08325 [Fidelibacterota bacterium]|nr:MAG: hypothetical protein JSU77_08325 [Candidatus Neomarinimicrobiota bacterium]
MKKLAYLLAFALPLWAQDDSCLDCHEVSTEESIHEGFGCLDCHTGLELEEHIDEGILPVFSQEETCGGCHEDAWNEHSASVHGLKLNSLSPDEATCVDCHGSHEILPADDSNSLVHSANMISTCGRCHANPELVERHNIDILDPVTRYKQSIHFSVLEESGYASATCNDCHGTHDIQNLRHSRSTINYWNVAETCGKCHLQEYEEFQGSDHWLALQRGVRDAPACITCHGEHAISDPTGRYDIIKKRELADHTCLKCHSDDELALKYGLQEGVAATYSDSYHGLAVMRGDEEAASCFDCHGVHAILGQEHENSTIHASNLQGTCAQCHPNATTQFAQTYTHSSVLIRETPIEDIVQIIYVALIIGVIGFMVVHNGVIFTGYLKQRKRGLVRISAGGEPDTPAIRRFSLQEIWQHSLLRISFTILAITGFALKFPESGWVQLLSSIGLSETARGLIHRIAAGTMAAVAVWHIVYALVSPWGRQHLLRMLPLGRDLRDFFRNMRASAKGRPPDVKYGLFDYGQKIEYWALVWGSVVMGLTGFILWFPTILGEATPVWLIKVSEVVHYWEAWLASLAIVIWHLFFSIFHPEEYPGSRVMGTGKMSVEEWRHKHAGFYEELEGELEGYRKGEITYNQLSPFAQQALKDLPPQDHQIE